MSAERRYPVQLTWDEIDDLQAALRARIWHYEDQAKVGEPSFVAEVDQFKAFWWDIVHRLGDARRLAHGEPLWCADDEVLM